MSVPDEQERKRRIEEDSGDPKDTVYYLRKHIDRLRHYHENPRCAGLEQSELGVLEMPRVTAQRKGWPPCKKCILNPESGKSNLEQLIAKGKVPDELLGSAYDG